MTLNFKNTYSGVNIRLDNHSYEDCIFNKCVIEYGGEGPIKLSGCRFDGCQWVFIGAAQNTLNFMQVMYHSMDEFGKDMIENTFNNIRTGGIPVSNQESIETDK